ncbi:Uridine cytidine kinase 2 [Fasciola gigantica]|uniref:uridine/cytidine kinase n=1 Tax=Fasciola gigantica TaxID=46835 RepID=A0A504YL79_FASGI|nr:Uridine cytidine kinase 2 [Fasciola gigantica]
MPFQKVSKPLLIGISGGAASGKTEVCRMIKEVLSKKANGKQAVILSLSSFYRELTPEERLLAENGDFDYDHPNSFDFKYLLEVLRKIKLRDNVTLQIYDCSSHANTPNCLEIPSDVDVVIVEGILTFYQKEIRDIFHIKIFIESDADTRLCRKGKFNARDLCILTVLSDVSEKGRSLDLVLDNYFKYVKPAFEEFCLPTKKYADVILPRAPDNSVGVDLITEHLIQLINEIPISSTSAIPRVRNQSESCLGSIRPH